MRRQPREIVENELRRGIEDVVLPQDFEPLRLVCRSRRFHSGFDCIRWRFRPALDAERAFAACIRVELRLEHRVRRRRPFLPSLTEVEVDQPVCQ